MRVFYKRIPERSAEGSGEQCQEKTGTVARRAKGDASLREVGAVSRRKNHTLRRMGFVRGISTGRSLRGSEKPVLGLLSGHAKFDATDGFAEHGANPGLNWIRALVERKFPQAAREGRCAVGHATFTGLERSSSSRRKKVGFTRAWRLPQVVYISITLVLKAKRPGGRKASTCKLWVMW